MVSINKTDFTGICRFCENITAINDIAVNETNGTVVVFSHNTGSECGKAVIVKLEEGIASSEPPWR